MKTTIYLVSDSTKDSKQEKKDSEEFMEMIFSNEDLKLCLQELQIGDIKEISIKKAKKEYGVTEFPFIARGSDLIHEGLDDIEKVMESSYHRIQQMFAQRNQANQTSQAINQSQQALQQEHNYIHGLPQSSLPSKADKKDVLNIVTQLGREQLKRDKENPRKKLTVGAYSDSKKDMNLKEIEELIEPEEPDTLRSTEEEWQQYLQAREEYERKLAELKSSGAENDIDENELFMGMEFSSTGVDMAGEHNQMEGYIHSIMEKDPRNPGFMGERGSHKADEFMGKLQQGINRKRQ